MPSSDLTWPRGALIVEYDIPQRRVVVAPKQVPADAQSTISLSDTDISAERGVTRRSLLGALGLGAGAAATVVFGAPEVAPAADDSSKKKKSKKPPKKPKEETDKD
jgi:hypothetical protein